MKGLVFNIQKLSLRDGPGIRTVVFMKGCPLRCPWCANPESQRREPEITCVSQRCIQCGMCQHVCPEKAITEQDGQYVLDQEKCTACGLCVAECCANAKQIVGEEMTVDEVLTAVKQDIPFYNRSGGGVTFSGGEPFFQYPFFKALLEACKEAYIHTAIETTGYTSEDHFQYVMSLLDTVYMDIKHMDPIRHKEITGVDNRPILENLKHLAVQEKKITIRIPVIPGYNDSLENICQTAQFIKDIPAVQGLELLPYHNLGKGKYANLGRPYALQDVQTPSDEAMKALQDGANQILHDAAIPCTIVSAFS